MQKLAGKNVLITGGNSGIGLATAKLFLEQGARVAITGRNAQALEQARQALDGRVLALTCDASKVGEIQDAMASLQAQWGGLDVLVVNAAIAGPAPFDLVSEAQFDELTSVNFKGVFFTVQKALPLLSAGSSVIVMTSISNQMGSPNFSVYAACKAGLRSMVQTLGLELIPRGIRINAISPGPITTPMWNKFGMPDEVAQAVRDEVRQKSPSKRFGLPEEVARTALFLAGEDASYIVGQEIVVDGGMSLL
jgi:NAD(P)-dependent dehydrogenase (short-subunit alcohol dehydrogenase family)